MAVNIAFDKAFKCNNSYYANERRADQPVHPHAQYSILRYLRYQYVRKYSISIYYQISVDEPASLNAIAP